MFEKRIVGIVTKHEKELLIGPILEHELGCSFELIKDIDTDKLGTFNGEIIRDLSPIETIQKKCSLGHEKGFDLVLASEGSFGFHPAFPFSTVNEELILLSDKTNEVQFIDRHITSETNSLQEKVTSQVDLENAVKKIGFPSHGIILELKKQNSSTFIKDINSKVQLEENVKTSLESGFECIVHSDMRAHKNPTRRNAIQKATLNLIHQLKSTCPNCNFPGFIKSDHEYGLPCANCLNPTKSIQKTYIKCKKCAYYETIDYPQNKYFEDPQFCDYCNP